MHSGVSFTTKVCSRCAKAHMDPFRITCWSCREQIKRQRLRRLKREPNYRKLERKRSSDHNHKRTPEQKERRRDTQAAWRAANPEKIKGQRRRKKIRYHNMTDEQRLKYSNERKQWRTKNKDLVKSYKKVENERLQEFRKEFGLTWAQHRKWMKLLFDCQVTWDQVEIINDPRREAGSNQESAMP